MHPQELERYVKGAEHREKEKQRAAERGSAPTPEQQRAEEKALQKYA